MIRTLNIVFKMSLWFCLGGSISDAVYLYKHSNSFSKLSFGFGFMLANLIWGTLVLLNNKATDSLINALLATLEKSYERPTQK